MIVPDGGVFANLHFADGTVLLAQSQLAVRATEYTVGPSGPDAMPATLPPTSGYTYAVELTADEAFECRRQEGHVRACARVLRRELPQLSGWRHCPTGYYDRDLAAWIPSNNGRVLRVLSIDGNGLAELDADGDSTADTAEALLALGITADERQKVASLYQPGQRLWRVPISHFTPWDHNWPYGPPAGSQFPRMPFDIDRNTPKEECCETGGSIIETENQTLGERLGIAGTPFTLNYRSDRVPGRASARAIDLELTAGSAATGLRRIDVEVTIAGQRFTQSFQPGGPRQTTFVWNGQDAYGRSVQGSQLAAVTIRNVYQAVYMTPTQGERSFAMWGNTAATPNQARGEFIYPATYHKAIGSGPAAPVAGIGGWTLDVHHRYDPGARTLFLGDGTRRSASAIGSTLETSAGDGNETLAVGLPARSVAFASLRGITIAPDGSMVFLHRRGGGGDDDDDAPHSPGPSRAPQTAPAFSIVRVTPAGIVASISSVQTTDSQVDLCRIVRRVGAVARRWLRAGRVTTPERSAASTFGA